DGQYRPHDESSRWRSNDGKCSDDEIVLKGSRVIAGDKSIIVPWTEKVYYGSQQNGYHGGATPQEMVCPVILLTDKTSAYSGLARCEYAAPEGWSAAPVASAETEDAHVTITRPPHVGPPTLFDMEPEGKPVAKPKKESKPATGGA